LEVLEWLNNGEPKLFKSPTEGNYIVRLMNVSLSPNDTLGRMIHTFNCTAYEIAENSYDNLEKFNFINKDTSYNFNLAWREINLSNINHSNNLLKNGEIATSIELKDL
jgi:hypothetical protein